MFWTGRSLIESGTFRPSLWGRTVLNQSLCEAQRDAWPSLREVLGTLQQTQTNTDVCWLSVLVWRCLVRFVMLSLCLMKFGWWWSFSRVWRRLATFKHFWGRLFDLLGLCGLVWSVSAGRLTSWHVLTQLPTFVLPVVVVECLLASESFSNLCFYKCDSERGFTSGTEPGFTSGFCGRVSSLF